jgi:hypothetical protein
MGGIDDGGRLESERGDRFSSSAHCNSVRRVDTEPRRTGDLMQILMFVLEDDAPDDDRSDDIDAWVAEADKGGRRVLGGPLDPVGEAVSVRVRRGHTERTSGSRHDVTAPILGFDVLECSSMDEAVDLAARHPMARRGRIELRALMA